MEARIVFLPRVRKHDMGSTKKTLHLTDIELQCLLFTHLIVSYLIMLDFIHIAATFHVMIQIDFW